MFAGYVSNDDLPLISRFSISLCDILARSMAMHYRGVCGGRPVIGTPWAGFPIFLFDPELSEELM